MAGRAAKGPDGTDSGLKSRLSKPVYSYHQTRPTYSIHNCFCLIANALHFLLSIIGRRAKEYISLPLINIVMLAEYIKAALDKATYEIIDDPEPFYGEIPELKGVWATGKTLEACRDNLMSALEDWIVFRLRTGRSIPSIGAESIIVSTEPVSVVE